MSRLAGPALALVMLTSIPGWAVANTDEGQPPPSAAALTPPPSTDPAVAAERRNLQAAVRMYTGGDVKGARPLLAAALASPVFAEMTEQERYAAHLLYGATLLGADAGQEALVQAKMATAFEQAAGDAWVLRFEAAWSIKDDTEAMFSLTTIAEHWPAYLNHVDEKTPLLFSMTIFPNQISTPNAWNCSTHCFKPIGLSTTRSENWTPYGGT